MPARAVSLLFFGMAYIFVVAILLFAHAGPGDVFSGLRGERSASVHAPGAAWRADAGRRVE